MKFKYCQINVVKNGWEVCVNEAQRQDYPKDIYVFETFEALTKWLKENLKIKKELESE